MNFSVDAIRALAPDEASFKAARGLCVLKQWPTLGQDAEAAWGECQGSGSKPYQTQIDLRAEAPSFRCSCPSRKFPCKHGLALLLLRVDQVASFTQAAAPPWVSEWLGARAVRAEKKETKAREQSEAPVDPAAQAKREAQRFARMARAGEELQLWLSDLIERGLGSLGADARGDWDTLAARMIDAQAPGLAARVRAAAVLIHNGSDWPERLLRQLGLLQLGCDALARRDAISETLQSELRVLLGWPRERAEVIDNGEAIDDNWYVLAQRFTELEGKLIERRVWLYGTRSARFVFLLDHRHGTATFERSYIVGSAWSARLHIFPGYGGLRALLGEISGAATPDLPLPGGVDAQLQAFAERIARSPWAGLQPLWCGDAQLVIDGDSAMLDSGGYRFKVALPEAAQWGLLAFSGGQRIDVFCEWQGVAVVPLAAQGPDGLWQWSGT